MLECVQHLRNGAIPHRGECTRPECVAHHRGVAEDGVFGGWKDVQPGGDQRLRRPGHGDGLAIDDSPDPVVLDERAAVEE